MWNISHCSGPPKSRPGPAKSRQASTKAFLTSTEFGAILTTIEPANDKIESLSVKPGPNRTKFGPNSVRFCRGCSKPGPGSGPKSTNFTGFRLHSDRFRPFFAILLVKLCPTFHQTCSDSANFDGHRPNLGDQRPNLTKFSRLRPNPGRLRPFFTISTKFGPNLSEFDESWDEIRSNPAKP